jgi:hypothetical protein
MKTMMHQFVKTGLCLLMLASCGGDSGLGKLTAPTPTPETTCQSTAQCAAVVPICLPTNKCGCSSDIECRAAGAGDLCDPKTLACVECLTDTDCSSDRRSQTCELSTHTCVQSGCKASTDCRQGDVCNTKNGICVECLVNADCSEGLCHPATYECLDCLANSDCPTANPVCSATGKCSTTCQTDVDCTKDRPTCDTKNHACVECLTNANCPSDSTCQPDLKCEEIQNQN